MLEGDGDHDRVLERAGERVAAIRATAGEPLPGDVVDIIRA
jgi:hypothetical protein